MYRQGDVLLVGGQAFPRAVATAREKLVERVQAHGFGPTMEAIESSFMPFWVGTSTPLALRYGLMNSAIQQLS